MAKYKETVHTDKAFALIGKMVAGKISELEFTKIKVSDKDYSKHTAEELKKLTALEQIKQETLVSEKTPVGDNAVNIHGIIYNTDLQSSYYLRTIGLYASDPDEGEILYSITATEVGDYIPTPNGNNITTAIIDILTEISDAKVNLSGNPSALVDVSMLNKKLDRGEGLEEEFDSAVKIVTELKKKQDKNDNALLTAAKNIVGAINELFSGKANKAHSHGNSEITDIDASKIKTGTMDISRLPQAALERCVVVADDTARFKLTKEQVQIGDSVKVTNPDNLMYIVVDDNKLNVEAGYVAYSAAIKWDGIKDKPSLFPPSSHTHPKNQITDFDHTHDDRYYTEAEIDTKFKNLNLVPVPVGGILFMYNTSNPAELYPSTTWELLPDNKLLKTGSTPLQQNGSNSIKIAKANLPAEKLQVEKTSVSGINHYHYMINTDTTGSLTITGTGYLAKVGSFGGYGNYNLATTSRTPTLSKTSDSGSGTSYVSPYTTNMGNGTPISINPEHITVKAWKRLS